MEERNFGYLGFSFQQSLIKAIIEDKKYGETIIDVLESKFFDNNSFRFIMENTKELYKNYNKIPDYNTLAQKIMAEGGNKDSSKIHVDTLEAIKNNESQIEYVKDTALNFCKQQNLKRELKSVQSIIESGEFEAYNKIEEIIHQKIDISSLPNDIKVEETPFLEHQDMLRSVDEQRKREDPDFKGAFHDKKWVIKARANGNKAALKGLGKNGLTRSGAVAQGVKTGPKANGKTAGKLGPKGPDRNNRPGRNSKYKTAAPGNKKKR